jgi:hypothetical protein
MHSGRCAGATTRDCQRRPSGQGRHSLVPLMLVHSLKDYEEHTLYLGMPTQHHIDVAARSRLAVRCRMACAREYGSEQIYGAARRLGRGRGAFDAEAWTRRLERQLYSVFEVRAAYGNGAGKSMHVFPSGVGKQQSGGASAGGGCACVSGCIRRALA